MMVLCSYFSKDTASLSSLANARHNIRLERLDFSARNAVKQNSEMDK